MSSSQLVEYLVALVVGVLAVLGAALCIGFLLVEPVRFPPSETQPTVSLADLLNSNGCDSMVTREQLLPSSCSLNGSPHVSIGSCSRDLCDCDADLVAKGSVCCCRATLEEVVQGIQCSLDIAPISNVTRCGCAACDDIEVTIDLSVVAVRSGDPVRAAPVFLMGGASSGDLTPIGITDNFGHFRYRESVSERVVVLVVRPFGYISPGPITFNLLPSAPRVVRQIVLMPTMEVKVGLGDSPLILHLGMISVSAPPRAFTDTNGDIYEDQITFRGNVVDIQDEDARAIIPTEAFIYTDPITGEDTIFTMFVGVIVEFVDTSGLPLTGSDDVIISVSVSSDETLSNAGDLFIVTFDPLLRRWNRTVNLSPVQGFRRKRQNAIIFDGRANSLTLLSAIAASGGVNCLLQTRVFETDGNTPSRDATVAMRQNTIIGNNPVLVQFTVQVNRMQTSSDNLVENAVCLPVACDNIISSSLSSTNTITGVPLFPNDFNNTSFDFQPLTLGLFFLFNEIFLNTPGPFYPDVESCRAAGRERNDVARRDSYFTFTQQDAIIQPVATDQCFIKILINDCFDQNSVMVTSVNPEGEPERREIFIVRPQAPVTTTMDPSTTEMLTTEVLTTEMFTTTDFSGDGQPTDPTTDPPTTQQPTTQQQTTQQPTTQGPTGPFVCNADTATRRGMCVPYICGNRVQVLVRTNPQSQRQSDFCMVERRSVLLSTPLLLSIRDEQLIVQSGDLLINDYNDPQLGLYTDTSSTPMSGTLAMQRCNAGSEQGMEDVINLDIGYAAIFECYE